MIRGRERVSTQVRMWLNYPYPNFPSKENLVGYWAFNEGTGTTAFDNSGNSNHGTLVNMEDADWVDGVVGKCLEFDGSNEYVNCGNDVSLKLEPQEDAFSLVCWFKTNVSGTLISKGVATASLRQYQLYTQSESIDVNLGGAVSSVTFTWDDSNWHFIAVTVPASATGHKMYIDGVFYVWNIDGGIGTEVNDAQDVNIGGRTNGGFLLTGLIDEVRIYDTALTVSEIKALYDYPGGV